METIKISGRLDPRPVSDAPSLEGKRDEIVKRWIAELVIASELAETSQLDLAQIACHGPALVSDLLVTLREESSGEPPHEWLMRLPNAVLALDLLRSILFANLLEEWQRPTVNQVTELAERLSWITNTLIAEITSPASPVVEDRRIETQLSQLVDRGEHFAISVVELGDYELLSEVDRVAADHWLKTVSRQHADRLLTVSHGRLWLLGKEAIQPTTPIPTVHGVPLSMFCAYAEFPQYETVDELLEAAGEQLAAARAAGLTLRPADATDRIS